MSHPTALRQAASGDAAPFAVRPSRQALRVDISDDDNVPMRSGLDRLRAELLRDATVESAIADTLDPEAQRLLVSRYGLDGGTPQTLREMADACKQTVEEVRRREIDALRALHGAMGLPEHVRRERPALPDAYTADLSTLEAQPPAIDPVQRDAYLAALEGVPASIMLVVSGLMTMRGHGTFAWSRWALDPEDAAHHYLDGGEPGLLINAGETALSFLDIEIDRCFIDGRRLVLISDADMIVVEPADEQ